MALLQATLEMGINTALTKGMSGGTTAEVAALLTQAYTTYAASALDPTGDPPLSVKSSDLKDEFEGKLENVLDSEGNIIGQQLVGGLPNSTTSQQAADLIANGVVKFWTGATFAIILPPPGAASELVATVTLPPVAETLSVNIKAVLDTKGNTQAKQATDLATAIHNATITTQVTCGGIGPPPTSAPVVLTGVIS